MSETTVAALIAAVTTVLTTLIGAVKDVKVAKRSAPATEQQPERQRHSTEARKRPYYVYVYGVGGAAIAFFLVLTFFGVRAVFFDGNGPEPTTPPSTTPRTVVGPTTPVPTPSVPTEPPTEMVKPTATAKPVGPGVLPSCRGETASDCPVATPLAADAVEVNEALHGAGNSWGSLPPWLGDAYEFVEEEAA